MAVLSSHPRLVLALLATAFFLAGSACGEDDFEFQQSLTFTGTMNLNNATFRAAPGEPAPFDEEAPIALGVDFLLSEISPELNDFKEKGLFRQLRFDQIKYTVEENTLTTDLEAIEVAFGPLGVTDPGVDEAILVATLPRIAAGQTASGAAEIHRENTQAASKLVFDLDFATAAGTDVTVRAGEPTPGGTMRIKVEMVFTLTADPL